MLDHLGEGRNDRSGVGEVGEDRVCAEAAELGGGEVPGADEQTVGAAGAGTREIARGVADDPRLGGGEGAPVEALLVLPRPGEQKGAIDEVPAVRAGVEVEEGVEPERRELHACVRRDVAGEHALGDAGAGAEREDHLADTGVDVALGGDPRRALGETGLDVGEDHLGERVVGPPARSEELLGDRAVGLAGEGDRPGFRAPPERTIDGVLEDFGGARTGVREGPVDVPQDEPVQGWCHGPIVPRVRVDAGHAHRERGAEHAVRSGCRTPGRARRPEYDATMTPDEIADAPDHEAIETYVARGLDAVASATSIAELDGRATGLVGSASPLIGWRRALGSIDPADRPRFGHALNGARVTLEDAIAARRATIVAENRAASLAGDRLDLTEVLPSTPLGHRHLVTQVREELEDVFIGMGFEIAEGPEIESEWYNFAALNMPRDHPARSIQDSFYLEVGDGASWLLRSQTSPTQIRLLERGELPIYAVAPGRVYRRDTPDARHLPIFHQIEGLVVDEGVTFAELAGTVEVFVKAIFGGSVSSRLRPGYFPFTEPSAEFDITCTICGGQGCRTCTGTGWIELGGCGMVHPAVFEGVGVDPERWTGFAFGFGIDRLAMMRHEIEDLRSLIESDVRFLRQF